MLIKQVTIDGIDYTRCAIYPLKNKNTLDESLDQSTLTLGFTTRELPFGRLSEVAIDIEDSVGEIKQIDRLVASDRVDEVIVCGQKKWTHTLILIELTKSLEREFVDTKTITNALDAGRKFKYVSAPVVGSVWTYLYSFKGRAVQRLDFDELFSGNWTYKDIGRYSEDAPQMSEYITPREAGTSVTFLNPNEFARDKFGVGVVPMKSCILKIGKNGNLVYQSESFSTQDYTISNIEDGQWVVQYIFEPFVNLTGTLYKKVIVQYKFSVVDSSTVVTVPPPYTIADVVDILCRNTRTLYDAETAPYSLDETQREWLSGVLSPEFAFTKETLWEALLTVGGYIHSIPRLLRGGIIHFDKLGQNDEFKINEKYYVKNYNADIENYCSELDTNVENMIFNEESNVVSIVDPDPQMARTTRVEEGEFRITEDNCLIWTTLPIYEVNHLWICDVDVSLDSTPNYQTYDLKQYLYEAAEYQALSSYSGDYPWSKNYAPYFTQGSRNIQGLNLRDQRSVITAFQHYAIYNILSKVAGIPGLNAEILSNHNNLANMLFRVEYIPLISARLKQRKPVWLKGKKSVLAYNQSENTVSGAHYGEKIKGAVAKLGNIEKILTFSTNKFANIPQTGALIEGKYYVMDVTIETLPEYMNVTCTLCEDYNKISEYIGLLSNRRYYEVSEKQSVNRQIIMEDICLISHNIDTTLNNSSQLSEGASGAAFMAQAFMGEDLHNPLLPSGTFNNVNITSVAFEPIGFYGKDIQGVLTQELIVPCVATAFGNSIALSWSMEDNYSVGPSSTGGLTPQDRTQTYTPYGDEFGRISDMYLIYITDGEYFPADSLDTELPAPYNTLHSQRVLEGQILPNGTKEISTTSGNKQFSIPWSSTYSLVAPRINIDKDSRERLSMTYQLHFQTLSANMIMGEALTRDNVLIKKYDKTKYLKMYVLPNKINKWDKTVDLTNATLVKDFSVDGGIDINGRNLDPQNQVTFVRIPEQVATASGQSYVLVQNGTNDLVLGENMSITAGDTIPQIIFQFTHNID